MTPPARGRALRLGVFTLLLGLFFLLAGPGLDGFCERVAAIHARAGASRSGFFLMAWGAALVAAVLLALSSSRWLRRLFWSVTAVSLATHLGVRALNGYGYELWEARMYWNEFHLAGAAVATFGGDLVPGILLGLGGSIVAAILAARFFPVIPARRALFALPLLAPMIFVIFRSNGEISSFPLVFKVPTIATLAALPADVAGGREAPRYEAVKPPLAPHVVMIVDESVRGDLLGLHDSAVNNTPFLAGLRDRLVDFGEAAAASNSSAPSNIILQSGMTPDRIRSDPQGLVTEPSLFQYARHAGFRTAYITAQSTKPENYMTAWDRDHIDHYEALQQTEPDLPEHDIDHLIPGRLAEILSASERTFTYVVKMGVHFPYERRHPAQDGPELAPLLPEVVDPERRERIDHYSRALRWTVDGFFSRLVDALDGREVLVVYTSDHGQSLATRLPQPHGLWKDPPRTQALVPLFLLPLGDRTAARLRERAGDAAARFRDRQSHYQLFPTLLEALGYDAEALRERHGPTLFAPGPEERFFLSGDPFKPTTARWNPF